MSAKLWWFVACVCNYPNKVNICFTELISSNPSRLPSRTSDNHISDSKECRVDEKHSVSPSLLAVPLYVSVQWCIMVRCYTLA